VQVVRLLAGRQTRGLQLDGAEALDGPEQREADRILHPRRAADDAVLPTDFRAQRHVVVPDEVGAVQIGRIFPLTGGVARKPVHVDRPPIAAAQTAPAPDAVAR